MMVTDWRFEEIVLADCRALALLDLKNCLSAAEAGFGLRPEKFCLATERTCQVT